RVLGAIQRYASDGDWRTNVSRGGSARSFALPPAGGQLAVRAAAALDGAYAGVDLLPSRDGTVFVLEVNGIPGWRGLQQATGLDVAGVIVDHLVGRVRAKDVPAGGITDALGDLTATAGEPKGRPAHRSALEPAADLPA